MFQSSTEDDATVETLRDKVLEWSKDVDDVINTSSQDEYTKINEYLEMKKSNIDYKITNPGGINVFRFQGKKRNVDVCMQELYKLLGRPYEPKTEIKPANASTSVRRGTQPGSNLLDPKPSVSQTCNTSTAGDLARGIDTDTQSQSKNKKSDYPANDKKKLSEKEKSTRQANDKKDEPPVHIHDEESLGKHQAVHTTNVPYKLDVTLESGLIFRAYSADITALKIDGLVNPANEDLHNTGGCALSISKAAGKEFDEDCKKIIKHKKKIKVTENVVSRAGNLKCKRIINAVGPEWGKYDVDKKVKCLEDLLKTVNSILITAENEKMSSVAIPPISSGIVLSTESYFLKHALIK